VLHTCKCIQESAYKHIRKCNAGAYVHRADPACNFRAKVFDGRNAIDVVQHLSCPMLITRTAALPHGIIYISLLIYPGTSESLSSSRTIIQGYVQRPWLKICVTFLQIRTFNLIIALPLVIKDFQKQASRFQKQEHVSLI